MTSDIEQFLSDTYWQNAKQTWFDADWSVRSYARLTNNHGDSAILLKSPPDDSSDAMIGHLVGEWVDMNKQFKSLGLNVPTIIKQDLSSAYILMEDFGADTIANKGLDAYLKATDILIAMRGAPCNDLKKYEDTHVYKALRFFPSYCLSSSGLSRGSSQRDYPNKSGNDAITEKWFAIWSNIESSLPPCPYALTHMDFAPQNLMWHNNGIGIIDFQAACDAPFVYDLVNLLEDIRIDVPDDIKQTCKDHYCAQLSPETRAIFDQWYIVITVQFHARILGQIQYLAQDKGRDDLMQYYDPLMKRFKKEIEHPLLKSLKDFIEKP